MEVLIKDLHFLAFDDFKNFSSFKPRYTFSAIAQYKFFSNKY